MIYRVGKLKVAKTSYPAVCPKCTSEEVELVCLGDPASKPETTTQVAEFGSVSVMTHYQFLACRKCCHSWNIPVVNA